MGIHDLIDRVRSGDEITDIPDDLSGLDDAEGLAPEDDSLPPDPKPGKRRARAPRPAAALKATAAQKRQVEDALVLMQTLLGGGLALRDPICGGAITTSAEQVARSAVPIICRNPTWLAWFTGGTGFLDVVGLLIALRVPVATAWGHHVSHTIGHSHEGEAEPVDYSAFTAPSI